MAICSAWLISKGKRAFLPFLLATPVLFLLGAITVYYVVIPIAGIFCQFRAGRRAGILPMELEPKVNEYLFGHGVDFGLWYLF